MSLSQQNSQIPPSPQNPSRKGAPFPPSSCSVWFIVSFGSFKSNSQHSRLPLQATHLALSGQSVCERQCGTEGTSNQDWLWQMSGSEFLGNKLRRWHTIAYGILWYRKGIIRLSTCDHYHDTSHVAQQHSFSRPMPCTVYLFTVTRHNSKLILCCLPTKTYTTTQTRAFKTHYNWLDLQFQFCVNAGVERMFHILDNLWNPDIKQQHREKVNYLFVGYHLLVTEKKLSIWKDKIYHRYGVETSFFI